MEWIDIKKERPLIFQRVLLHVGRPDKVKIGFKGINQIYENEDGGLIEPTHWIPLPKSPNPK